MSEQLDCVVIGAGVVGLAIARSLAMSGRDVIVLEREEHIGMHTSSRNSEVIHAGIYYDEGSLKARLCVSGKALLYAYCADRGVPFHRIGKLIVASSKNELGRLHDIQARARKNSVQDLRMLSAAEVFELDPAVRCAGGLLSPSTGIIDSHAYMLSLQGDIESHGGVVVCNSEVSKISAKDDGFYLKLASGSEEWFCKTLINSAGHDAQTISRIIGFNEPPTRFLAIGHYFAYQGASPFNHLIYPIPDVSGLGIHATNDMGGSARFGPDVTWVDDVNYEFDENRKPDFVKAIRRYFPDLDEDKLLPSYTGIRPKLSGPGEPASDFVIQGEEDHGVRGLVNLFGIESPGLTSSMAIAEHVKSMLGGNRG